MANNITWDTANFKWNDNDHIWNDVQEVIESIEGGRSSKKKDKKLEAKKLKVIRLVMER